MAASKYIYPRKDIDTLCKDLIQAVPKALREEWNGPLQRYVGTLYKEQATLASLREGEAPSLSTIKTSAELGIQSCLRARAPLVELGEKLRLLEDSRRRAQEQRTASV